MNSLFTNATLLNGIISSLPILSIANMVKHTLRKVRVENLAKNINRSWIFTGWKLPYKIMPQNGRVSNIFVSQQPLEQSQFRQQQSICRVLISRIGVSFCIFQWGLHGGIIVQTADFGHCYHYDEALQYFRFSTTTRAISIPTTAIDPQDSN